MTTEIAAADTDAAGERPEPTYAEIVKSTSLIGLTTIISLFFMIFRTKVLALLLGPAGVGLYGLFSVIADLAGNIAGMGVNSSGVRQIAESAGTGDDEKIGRTIAAVNYVSAGLGAIGAAVLIVFSKPIAQLTLGAGESWGVALIGFVVFFKIAAGACSAIVQGTRRIGDLARMGVLGAAIDMAVSVPSIYFFGEKGIALSLLAMAVASYLVALAYRRRVPIRAARLDFTQLRREAGPLLGLGFAFMASAMMSLGAAYAVRVLLLQQFGIVEAGLYQSAWSISGLYVGVVLQAMSTDFYPRLTGAAHDDVRANRMVNEQTEVSMLLAAPGLIGTMTLAPLIMLVFYSSAFQPAVPMLRWLCFGMLLRVLAWPIGFVLLSKGARRLFFWSEVAAALVQVGLTALLTPLVGPIGAGIAFVGLYVWHGGLVYYLVHRLTGFHWSAVNFRLAGLSIVGASAVLLAVSVLPFWPGTLVGLAASAASGLYALSELMKLAALPRFLAPLRPLAALFATR